MISLSSVGCDIKRISNDFPTSISASDYDSSDNLAMYSPSYPFEVRPVLPELLPSFLLPQICWVEPLRIKSHDPHPPHGSPKT